METLTIFTPTYNRAKFLPRAFEALKRQTLKDFLWMIIDDGSTDNTEEVVQDLLKDTEAGFKIEYVKKENGGLHTGYNKAINSFIDIRTVRRVCLILIVRMNCMSVICR